MREPRKHFAIGTLLLAVLLGARAWAVEPKTPSVPLDAKELAPTELAVSSTHTPLGEVLAQLGNREAWEDFAAAEARSGKEDIQAFIDRRSGTATNLLGRFPVIPGTGVGNQVTLDQLSLKLGRPVSAVDSDVVGDAVQAFVREHADVLGVDTSQLGAARAARVNPDLWQVSIPQFYNGIPVRRARLAGSISHGNLVVIGTERWHNVRDLSTAPAIGGAQALEAGFAYAGGRLPEDQVLSGPALEIVPAAPPEHPEGEAFTGQVGTGYRHLLVWSFTFRRPPDDPTWEVLVDARTGEVLAFQDVNHYISQSGITRQSITGGVYPLTSTEICPTPQTCGTMQSGWPMPFADTGLAAPNNFTNSAGIFDYPGGTVRTTLTGKYVDIVDSCGAINNSASGSINLGGANGQHNCTSAGGSAGNTAASRAAFYEVNKLAEMARGWLPGNLWLGNRLTTNVNLNNVCNAFYEPLGTINFYRSGGGCRNTGEIAAVFDHEWGHALDDNDSIGVLSNSSEAYADIAAIYRLQSSCVGSGFFWTNNRGCGQTSDGTGFNANEALVGAAHCNLDCSGVRDADWDKHADRQPDTALGFVCGSCTTSNGPCLRQVHCAAAPTRQAAWDLVARDLRGAPFNLDSQTAFVVGNRLFYQGSGNVGDWHSCVCGVLSDGCGATNGYMQWLAADDDNGLLLDGTPHMTALHAAFNRHGIACNIPTPANSGCGAGPTASPTLVASPGSFQVSLSWNAVPGAVRYWVFRTEGHAGCNFGKTLIAETELTAFTDTAVANGRAYYYNVAAVGASSACFTRLSNCATATPSVPIRTTANVAAD